MDFKMPVFVGESSTYFFLFSIVNMFTGLLNRSDPFIGFTS